MPHGPSYLMTIHHFIACGLTVGWVVQLWFGAAWMPRRRIPWRWIEEDDDRFIWRSHSPLFYWFIVTIEAAFLVFFWLRVLRGDYR